MTITSLYLVS